MSARAIKLLGSSGELLATGRAVQEGDHFAGPLDLTLMPAPMLRTFQEFEEIVNGQLFSLLGNIAQHIDDLAIQVVFDDERAACVEDLQIYPSTGLTSFKAASLTESCPATRK